MIQLSKDEMKRILGGNYTPPVGPPDDGNGCDVTCGTGYYACCYRNVLVSYCPCVANGSNPPSHCDAGGAGATECKVEQEF